MKVKCLNSVYLMDWWKKAFHDDAQCSKTKRWQMIFKKDCITTSKIVFFKPAQQSGKRLMKMSSNNRDERWTITHGNVAK